MATKNGKAGAPAPAAEPAEAAPKRTYTVTSPLDHDQVRYEVGAEVQLTDAQAAPLLGFAVQAVAAG